MRPLGPLTRRAGRVFEVKGDALLRRPAAGEFMQSNPSFSMQIPLWRPDGTLIQRTGLLLHAYPPRVPNELYASHAVRDGLYLGALVRTLVPAPAQRDNLFYPALMSVYLSTFAP